MVYTYDGMSFSLKKEGITDTCYMDKPWKHAKWNKPVTKGQMLFESACMEVPKIDRFIETESRMVLSTAQGRWGWGVSI